MNEVISILKLNRNLEEIEIEEKRHGLNIYQIMMN